MNPIVTYYKNIVLSIMVFGGLTVPVTATAVCTPCQAAAAAREAARQSARDAAAQAALVANKPAVGREVELDLDSDDKALVKACCSACEKTGKPCGGDNSSRCITCQEGLIKQSIADALASTLAAATVIIQKKITLSDRDGLRAPRQCIPDACNDCDATDDQGCSTVIDLLQSLVASDAMINAKLDAQGKAARKCCKRVKDRLEDIEEMLEVQGDQSIECCSIIETTLGSVIDQSAACCSALELQITNLSLSVADVFVLLQSVFDCTCNF